MYTNKKILILGAAKSGISVAKLLAKYNNEIILTDLSSLENNVYEELSNLGIKIVITNNQLDLIDSSLDMVVKNPAIMSTSPLIKRCEELGLLIVNEMEVAYHYLPKDIKIIGVTGSNGKTTTTTIIYNMLKCLGKSVVMGGNIGTPLCDLLEYLKSGDILLLEISDHQLCDMHDFKTDISVITNICPTHLDYHGTYEHYKMTKKNIFNNHTNSDIAIINYENSDVLEISEDILSHKKYFSSNKQHVNAYLDNDKLYLNGECVLNKEDIKLKGIHNYENILASLLVIEEFGLDIEKIKGFLSTFGGVAHRLEFVRTVNGVTYYNDSKSTNPTSTITALKTFKEPVHLILGGLNRNQDFHELDNYIKNVKYIYAIGSTTDIVSLYAKSMNIPCILSYNLKDALASLEKNVSNGDVVLLSPASSSQDQYSHFEDRGKEFKNIVEKF